MNPDDGDEICRLAGEANIYTACVTRVTIRWLPILYAEEISSRASVIQAQYTQV